MSYESYRQVAGQSRPLIFSLQYTRCSLPLIMHFHAICRRKGEAAAALCASLLYRLLSRMSGISAIGSGHLRKTYVRLNLMT